jgi:Membrane protein involved in the export of O-antigen and teichoic acid
MIKDFSRYTISNVISRGLNFVIIIILSNFYSTAQYGTISLGYTYLGLFMSLFAFGFCEGVQRFYLQLKSEGKKYILGNVLVLQFVFFVLAVVVLFVLFFCSSIFKEIDLVVFFLVVCISYIKALQNIFLSVLQMEQMTKKYAVISVFISLLDCLFIYVFIYLLKGDVFVRFFVLLFCNIIGLSFLVYNTRVYFSKPKMSCLREMKSFMSFCFPSMILPVVSWILSSSDKILLSKLQNLNSLGVYALAGTLSQVLSILYLSFNTAYTPIFYSTYEKRDKIRRIQSTFICFFCISLMAYLVCIRYLFPFFIHKQAYESSLQYFHLFCVGTLFSAFSSMNISYLAYAYKSKLILLITVCTSVVNIVVNYFMIKNFGPMGAVVASTCSMFLQMIVAYLFAIHYGYNGWIWKEVGPFGVLVGAFCLGYQFNSLIAMIGLFLFGVVLFFYFNGAFIRKLLGRKTISA